MTVQTQYHHGCHNDQATHTDEEQEVYGYKHLPQLLHVYALYYIYIST